MSLGECILAVMVVVFGIAAFVLARWFREAIIATTPRPRPSPAASIVPAFAKFKPNVLQLATMLFAAIAGCWILLLILQPTRYFATKSTPAGAALGNQGSAQLNFKLDDRHISSGDAFPVDLEISGRRIGRDCSLRENAVTSKLLSASADMVEVEPFQSDPVSCVGRAAWLISARRSGHLIVEAFIRVAGTAKGTAPAGYVLQEAIDVDQGASIDITLAALGPILVALLGALTAKK